MIRRKIAREAFVAGNPLPPTRDFAKETGLSNSMVYRVLLKLADEKILHQHSNGRFYPKNGETDPRHSDQSFACLLPRVDVWSAALQGILNGLTERSRHYRRGTLLFHEDKLIQQKGIEDKPVYATVTEQQSMLAAFLKLHGEKCEGILFDNIWSDEAIQPFEKQIKRAVIINRTTRLPFASSVCVDYRLASTLALSHFLAAGFRDIYFITSYEDSYVNELRAFLLQTAEEIGASLDASHCLVVSDSTTRRQTLRTICKGRSRVGIFCPEENHAQLIQAEAYLQGLEVPGKLGILSGTGTPMAADAHLSTLSVDFALIGSRAVDLLRAEFPAEEIITPKLVRRETT
jgi:DNA-binding LacI/PurR family transcriptional regulator